MGASKKDFFTDEQNEYAILFRALAHPARVAIVEYLMGVGSCICGDIVSELPLAQPTVSQHLKELKSAGLIRGNIDGNSICYCLEENSFEKLQSYISAISVKLQNKKQICC